MKLVAVKLRSEILLFVSLCLLFNKVSELTTQTEQLTSATSITSLLPGHLLSGLITSILPTGLNLKLLGYYSGTISSLHLPLSTPTDSFKIGQKIKCRILWGGSSTGVGGDEDSGKKFALSAEEGVLGFAGEERGWGGLKVGEVLEVEVKEVDEEWGLECEVEKGEWKGRGFVHVSLSFISLSVPLLRFSC